MQAVFPNMNCLETAIADPAAIERDDDIEAILHLIEERGDVTRSDVEKYLNISASTAVRLMNKMKDCGYIVAVGKGKRVKYRIAE